MIDNCSIAFIVVSILVIILSVLLSILINKPELDKPGHVEPPEPWPRTDAATKVDSE